MNLDRLGARAARVVTFLMGAGAFGYEVHGEGRIGIVLFAILLMCAPVPRIAEVLLARLGAPPPPPPSAPPPDKP